MGTADAAEENWKQEWVHLPSMMSSLEEAGFASDWAWDSATGWPSA